MSKLISHLSFSRLKALSHSPLALKKYLERSNEQTKAMKAGNILDCLLFTPDLFDKRYIVIPDVSLATKEGKAQFAAAKDIATEGQQIIKQGELDEAKFLETCIRQNSTVAFTGLLNADQFRFQVETSFFYGGFLHKGVKDAEGKDRDGNPAIWDLKRMGNSSGEKLVRSQIRANKYDLQAAIYCWPYDCENKPVKYYIIAVDNDGFVTPFEISKDARQQARYEWNIYVKAAHACNGAGLDMGPEFWAGMDGFFIF